MCRIKCTYVVSDRVQIRVQGNGKELSIEEIEVLKKMIKLAHHKIQSHEN
jgi:hypothetical protein